MTKRAPNLKDILFRRKIIALSSSTGASGTVPCTPPETVKRGAKCQCCALVSGVDSITNNNIAVKTCGGNCKSFNIVYAAQCAVCVSNNTYFGKSVQALHERVNNHRSSFYDILRKSGKINFNIENLEIDDENILGAHIFRNHKMVKKSDFNNCFTFNVKSIVNPDKLRFTEQLYIDKLNTLIHFGLNQINSVG